MLKRPASIKVRALQWLAQREHSRSELRVKLLRLLERPLRGDRADFGSLPADDANDPVEPGDAAREVDTLLDWLTTHGYLSPGRFVESRVHARQRRFGNLRIQQELKQHGVGLEADAQLALKASEFERALAVWRKKFGVPAEDATGRVRQMRFLTGRGFTPEVIRRVLRGQTDDDASPEPGPDCA